MLLDYTFFQNALLGALLASVLCAIVGTYVVTRRMVIAGGGMAHASLGGIGKHDAKRHAKGPLAWRLASCLPILRRDL